MAASTKTKVNINENKRKYPENVCNTLTYERCNDGSVFCGYGQYNAIKHKTLTHMWHPYPHFGAEFTRFSTGSLGVLRTCTKN